MKRMICISLLLMFLTGCYDKVELEQQSYNVAIGVDQTDKEGTYEFTFQITNPEVGTTSGGGSDEEPNETVTTNGSDILTAMNTVNSFVSKRMTLDHTKVIVISEELARSGDFLQIIQAASRTTQIRRATQIVVSKESAAEFLNNIKPKMETRTHKYFQYMITRATQTGIIPDASVHRFFQITEGDADLFLAIYATNEHEEKKGEGYEDQYVAGEIPQEGGSDTQFMGSAVFKEGKMIDTLDGQDTRIAHVLDYTLDMDELLSTYPDPIRPEYRVAADYIQKTPAEVEIQYNKNKPTKIDVTVSFQIEVLAIPSLVNYSQNSAHQELLRKAIITDLESKANKLIKKTQEEYGSDPFYWSLFIRDQFIDVPAYEEADWNKKIYPNADITVSFNLKRLAFGKMLNDTNLSEVRD
ncbi:Ger(x)C family spore germination protein [Aquibacillus koreensis]|uniref:Ger(X)C family spore germination protein n=1 Tax=Aquibacillus koreensis TaxID=279446 RepID=A0A9X3WSQ1_9BACI|nr:Ger(x)C family spore germination protein [Aquibacillus koreensis]MCT2536968.1 Ger(x)C family spore germination protein [Aquibacillus koreensis]MDC3422729.1 Ger(x)C family spore germination protein [Aquibacillus koreensis]